ncbi:hypothetical protein ZEAMMB73_Zm00001d040632 [Zea mays]|uniref:DYW domain-containing protein n=1 Tax=Zea mays TaxID=4577 RepID=A0A1D6MRV1_MAIZE|nr:hypothetical protein ZEAMMB73_Zm00001d040632 [Zea mays]
MRLHKLDFFVLMVFCHVTISQMMQYSCKRYFVLEDTTLRWFKFAPSSKREYLMTKPRTLLGHIVSTDIFIRFSVIGGSSSLSTFSWSLNSLQRGSKRSGGWLLAPSSHGGWSTDIYQEEMEVVYLCSVSNNFTSHQVLGLSSTISMLQATTGKTHDWKDIFPDLIYMQTTTMDRKVCQVDNTAVQAIMFFEINLGTNLTAFLEILVATYRSNNGKDLEKEQRRQPSLKTALVSMKASFANVMSKSIQRGAVPGVTSPIRPLRPTYTRIIDALNAFSEQMAREGHVPNTEDVFQDIEEEHKSYVLCVHSEKLAIVFGIISTPAGTKIRVMKNLRVCIDCHTVTKFISKLADREIVFCNPSKY